MSTVVDAMGKIADGDFSAATEFQEAGSMVGNPAAGSDDGEPLRRMAPGGG
ncbi:MAG: hypothetical protein ACRDY7_00245 [Acidimicrobiia bacterium]